MLHRIRKSAIGIESARVNFTDGEAEPVAHVCRSRPSRSRCLLQEDANDGRLDRRVAETKLGIAATCAGDLAVREHAPAATQHILVVFGRLAFPILNIVIDRIGLGPKDAQCVDGNVFPEIDENPLRIKRVVFAGVKRVKIGVALPEAFLVAV